MKKKLKKNFFCNNLFFCKKNETSKKKFLMNKENLLNIAITAALKGGFEILEVYGTADFNVELKSDHSPLTIADKRANAVIMNILEETNIPILSEEGKSISYEERKNWNTFWLVDPLDGTKEFIKRNDEFTVNIALIENGIPTLGVIYVPVLKDLYVAEIAEGAFKKTNVLPTDTVTFRALQLAENKLPFATQRTEFVVVGSRSHMNEETTAFIEKIAQGKGTLKMISKGSSLKLCMIAEGIADFYPRFGPTMEWDTAAGQAIVLASGATVTHHDTEKPLLYNKENLLNPWFIVKR